MIWLSGLSAQEEIMVGIFTSNRMEVTFNDFSFPETGAIGWQIGHILLPHAL